VSNAFQHLLSFSDANRTGLVLGDIFQLFTGYELSQQAQKRYWLRYG